MGWGGILLIYPEFRSFWLSQSNIGKNDLDMQSLNIACSCLTINQSVQRRLFFPTSYFSSSARQRPRRGRKTIMSFSGPTLVFEHFQIPLRLILLLGHQRNSKPTKRFLNRLIINGRSDYRLSHGLTLKKKKKRQGELHVFHDFCEDGSAIHRHDSTHLECIRHQ